MTDVTDLKQVKVSRITLGLIMSVAITSGVVVWNAASIAGRIDDLEKQVQVIDCLLYTSPSPRDRTRSRMPSSA